MGRRDSGLPEILTPGDVARLFGVDPKTVTRWAKKGVMPYFMTPRGHRRYRRDEILEILNRSKSK